MQKIIKTKPYSLIADNFSSKFSLNNLSVISSVSNEHWGGFPGNAFYAHYMEERWR